MRNDGKPCVGCRAESCDPCPEMVGEGVAVLELLERLYIEGHFVAYYRYPRNAGGNWVVEFYLIEEGKEFNALMGAEAPMLYQALLLAAEALDENAAIIEEAHDEK